MKKRFGVAIVSGVLIVLISMFIGCTNELEEPRLGSLALSSGDMQSRTIQPREDLIDVVKYRVSGVGPGGTTFNPVVSETTPITINNLKAGTWTITVEGLNSEDAKIAEAALDVSILSNKKTNATFYLQWIEGFGDLDITVTWPSSVTTFARIHGVLSQNGTEIKTFNLQVEDATDTNLLKTITKSYTGLDTGSYDFVLTFFDSNGSRVGLPYMEQVNIYDGMTSTGICAIPEQFLPIEPPVITPAGGRLAIGQTVSISSASENVAIYYTLDGSSPTIRSELYDDPFVLRKNATVKAIAISPDRYASEVTSADFQVFVAPPVFSMPAAEYDSPQTITISSVTTEATIYYTTDGTNPTINSAKYTEPLTISTDTTLKAIAIHSNGKISTVTTADYVILGSSGMDIVDPPYAKVVLQLPEGWDDAVVPYKATGIAKAIVTPTPDEGDVTYSWYVDGELAMNNAGGIASTGEILSFGENDTDVKLGVGPHVLVVKVTKGSMTYSDQKLISVAVPPGITHIVSFDSQGGSHPDPDSIAVIEGQAYGTLPTATREGYTFDGWWTAPNGQGSKIAETSTITISGDHTLYAAWKQEGGYVSVRLTSTTDPSDVREATLRFGILEDGTDSSFPLEMLGVPVAMEVFFPFPSMNSTMISATGSPVKEKDLYGTTSYINISIPLNPDGTGLGMPEINVIELFPEYSGTIYRDEKESVEQVHNYTTYESVGGYVTGTVSMNDVSFYCTSNPFEHISLGKYNVELAFHVKRIEDVHMYSMMYVDDDSRFGNIYGTGMVIILPGGAEDEITKEGYTFKGWNTEADGNGIWYAGGETFTMPDHDVTLYAMWERFYGIGSIGPAGGYVFYDKGEYSDGWRYLEAAPYGWYDGDSHSFGSYTGDDDPRFQWGAGDYESEIYEVHPSAKSELIGSGRMNTDHIVAYHDSLGTLYPEKGDYYTNPTQYSDRNDGTVAAKICSEYTLVKDGVTYDDWYLPSIEELWLMHSNLVMHGLGGFTTYQRSFYWSSTEREDGMVSTILMGNSQPYSGGSKNNNFMIRPIRAF